MGIASTAPSGANRQPAIVESIVALAKTLGTQVIAEGVENEQQLDELVRLGCSQAQGFLFSKPLPASMAAARLAESIAGWTTTIQPLPAGARLADRIEGPLASALVN